MKHSELTQTITASGRSAYHMDEVDMLVAQLEELLNTSRRCLKRVDDKSIFGVAGDGSTHWYLADALLADIDRILEGEG